MKNNLPDITERIKSIIDTKFKGNVRQFSFAMGLTNSAKINRLFLKDKRNDEYPIPSTEIILLISNTFNISTDWLLKGATSDENESVNNLTIDDKKANGDKNSSDIDYLEIIKEQQSQITQLIELLRN